MFKPNSAVPALMATFSLVVAACSSSGAPGPTSAAVAPAPPTAVPPANGAVTAGTQIGTLPSAPAGWTPPATIAPVNPLPGMFQSVGTTPQPGAKVRVFFLGMQW
jgi:hypothetical protein